MHVTNMFMTALVLGAVLTASAERAAAGPQYPALEKFTRAMKDGRKVKIAYFGGSITWGATASDPLKTSWRVRVTAALESDFPRARIQAIDAAIGGLPSKLGVFRMDRDVLPYKPDLCFVEFAVNDRDVNDSAETVEGIIRKLRACREDMAIVLVIIGNISMKGIYDSPVAGQQTELANYYGLPCIDVYSAVKTKLDGGLKTTDILTDGTHPNDAGYRLYADIILAELGRLAGARGPAKPAPDKPLTTNRYESATMVELAKLPDLGGWKVDSPSVVGTWFDQQPSRWQSSAVVPVKDGAELATEELCSGLGLYYELTGNGGPIVLAADGKTVLDIKTAQTLPFQRVSCSFALLDGPAQRRKVTLTAPQAANTKAAYLLYTR
ncbi:MAG: SGNH/GDSL hydrolase family protein [Lentisphaerae bacterium]|nr:SGNH/GDSL hydrolase family protein [Lentisphaerota bacterium]